MKPAGARCGSPFLALCVVVAGCTTNQVAVPALPVPKDLATSAKLQLAVGTANIAAQMGRQVRGLNVVATFRDSSGNNATGVNTPTLAGPPGFAIAKLGCSPNAITQLNATLSASPAPNVFAGTSIATLKRLASGPPQTQITLPPSFVQFGPAIGVFGYGFGAYNEIPASLILFPGDASNYNSCVNYAGIPFTQPPPNVLARKAGELALPIGSEYRPEQGSPVGSGVAADPALLYTQAALAVLPITSFGGPPAWPAAKGYGNFAYFSGYPEGFTDFGIPPVAGTYTLGVSYPTAVDYSTSGSFTATARLNDANAVLPAMPQPSLTINTDGSGLLKLTVPPGVTETIVNVTSSTCALTEQSALPPENHFSVVIGGSGPRVVVLANALGPPLSTGVASHTFCTPDDVAALNASLKAGGSQPLPELGFTVYVQAIGFDYPAYEASYPQNRSEAPLIVGPAGTADITTSYPFHVTYQIAAPART